MVFGVWAVVVRFGRALRRGWSEEEFRGLLSLVAVLVAGGSVFYRFAEDWGWVDSVYFTVITLTTVGYGDLSPTSGASKLFTVILVLLGVGILITFVERVARYAAADAAARRRDGTAED
jgi:hypothetical protein